ncbi:MAG: 2-polyprenyl-3-methyl-5-hydroxy-6-metoxy-1,4-benzoquinol methylase [Rhodothermales bacterium]|jgi:2-polyprenyl-3-methyl-5-hydroxy-6-metoxy-1,4-benzoquinol methylase
MSTYFLGERQQELVELMDDPACDLRLLDNTYAHFATLNRLIAGWTSVYRRWIRPRLRRGPATVLDIGCGGGDVLRLLAGLANRDGLVLLGTGIDPDERAIAFASRTNAAKASGIELLPHHSKDLVREGRTFDFVISNHVLHHLDADAMTQFLADSEALATVAAVHNDIRRHDLGYAGFEILSLAFMDSFIRPDGKTSIRRSYSRDELAAVLPDDWTARTLFPFRLLAVHVAT